MSDAIIGWVVSLIVYALIVAAAFAIEGMSNHAVNAINILTYVALATAIHANWKASNR